MRLLFLDTETSGLTPKDGQIIEIAAVLYDFDEIDLKLTLLNTFESTVALEGDNELSSKITQITGITKEELSLAPKRNIVCQNWSTWLESLGDIQAIVGHSIDFDLNFLLAEKWQLLEKNVIVDTLNLSRVLLSNMHAVSLEYLEKYLDIIPDTTKINKNFAPHRALYDTFTSANLFQFLVKRLADLQLPADLYKVFIGWILPLNINFYSQFETFGDFLKNIEIKQAETNLTDKTIDWQLDKPNYELDYKIEKYNQEPEILTLFDLLKINIERFKQEPKNLKYTPDWHFCFLTITCLIVASIQIQKKSEQKPVKIHGKELYDYWLVNQLLDQKITDSSGNIQILKTKPIESLIFEYNNLANFEFNFQDLLFTLKTLEYFLEDSDLKPFKEINFYYSQLNSLFQSKQRIGIYQFSFDTNDPTDKEFIKIILKIESALTSLVANGSNSIVDFFLKKIVFQSSSLTALISQSQNKTRIINIRFQRDFLILGTINTDFKLSDYLSQKFTTLNTNYSLKLTTNFPKSILEEFLQLFEIQDVWEKYNQNQIEEFEILKNAEITDLKNYLLDLSNQAGPNLILCGQNSTMRDFKKILPEMQNYKKPIHMLGETGSLTKLASKIETGFDGVVISKTNDYYFYRKFGFKFKQIIQINPPFLHFDQNLIKIICQRQNKNFGPVMNKIKELNILAFSALVKSDNQIPLIYIRSYSQV